MSRVRIFDTKLRPVGEFTATVNRGWALAGSANVQGGTQTTFVIPDSVAAWDALQFGRMVLIEHEQLPAWAGVIDTPWTATLPVSVTCYSAEYLLSLRSIERQQTLTGSFERVMSWMIAACNELGDLGVRMGTMGTLPDGQQQLTLQQRPIWEQLNGFGEREGVEFSFRPEINAGEPLVIYIDAGRNLGRDDGFLLKDGPGGNMKISGATVDGEIRNRMIGTGSQSTNDSLVITQAYANAESGAIYQVRNAIAQFQNLTLLSSIETAAQNALSAAAWPMLRLDATLTDVGGTFAALRPGNWYNVHAANLFLPGGKRGWMGKMRIMAMAYDERQNVVVSTLEAAL